MRKFEIRLYFTGVEEMGTSWSWKVEPITQGFVWLHVSARGVESEVCEGEFPENEV